MAKTEASGEWKKIREPAYKIRLELACDNSPHCPDPNHGRMGWLQAELKKRGHEVSRESVKRWLHGETRPREEKSDALADILGVDHTWLFVGREDTFSAREKRAYMAEASAAANLVAAIIQMDGGAVAFPDKSEGSYVDFYAIIKGGNYPIHAVVGHQTEDGIIFKAPPRYQDIVTLGLVRDGMNITVIELKHELIEAGKPQGGWIDVVLSSDQIEDNTIPDFTKRF